VLTSSAVFLRKNGEIRSLLLEVARRSFGMTLKVAPFPLSLKQLRNDAGKTLRAFGMTQGKRFAFSANSEK
jgi:hypothetical protein